MKFRFFLLDINEDRVNERPAVHLWGIDEKDRRVVVTASLLMPYFYLLPSESQNPEAVKDQLLQDRGAYPELLSMQVEDKKFLGRPRKALRVNCSDSAVVSTYAKKLCKSASEVSAFEQDFRLSARYLTDYMLTPCGWHECEVEVVRAERPVQTTLNALTVPKPVVDDAVPKLRILALSLLAIGERGSAKPERDAVRAIAMTTNTGKNELLLNSGFDDSGTLREFVRFVEDQDPDIIVGFDTNRLDWPYLIRRARSKKIRLAVGRDQSEPHTSLYGHTSITGRVNLDLADIASGILEIKIKTVENFAKFLHAELPKGFSVPDESERNELWKDPASRERLLTTLRQIAQITLDVAEATLNFPMQLSALTGLPLDHVMTAAVGFRVDSYLIRQAHQLGELIPPRSEQPFYTYRGAVVLEPETGLHDNIVVLDFSSMYPNLMMKYNLSPDTLVRPGEKLAPDQVYVVPEVKHRFRKKPDGLYRTALSNLILERVRIKEELKELGEKSTRYKVLKERERAVKIIANACYGYAGWLGARWYSKEVAESAAALGRETITKTIEKAKGLGLQIIYGDTDSIFVRNDREKVKRLLKWVEDELGLEIRPEREYVRVLFTEAMKRYAGLLQDGSLDIVGLEVVRGDWSDLARQVQEQVLIDILREQSIDKAVADVRRTIDQLRSRKIPIESLTIRKTLTKPIEQYAVRAPHVEVAKLLLKQGWDLGLGDKVAYVIVQGPGKLFQKSRPSHQARLEDVDTEYYLENQVKPAAMRILERFGVKEEQLKA